MKNLKKNILFLPFIPVILWTLFGVTYLLHSGDLAISVGMVAVFASFIVGIVEIILIIIYIKFETVHQTLPQAQVQTTLSLGFGDSLLVFFTGIYLFAYYFAIGHSFVDISLLTICLCSVFGAIFCIKKVDKRKAAFCIWINFITIFMLFLYVLLMYERIYGNHDVESWFSILNISIFSGFFLDFYCMMRLRKYTNQP